MIWLLYTWYLRKQIGLVVEGAVERFNYRYQKFGLIRNSLGNVITPANVSHNMVIIEFNQNLSANICKIDFSVRVFLRA